MKYKLNKNISSIILISIILIILIIFLIIFFFIKKIDEKNNKDKYENFQILNLNLRPYIRSYRINYENFKNNIKNWNIKPINYLSLFGL